MSFDSVCDEDLIRRLPLPLAKLYRRAHNAKTPFDRHQTAYFLWEVALKLLSSTTIIAVAEMREHDPAWAETLKALARPALGHWWEFVRLFVPVVADSGDAGFQQVRALVLDRTRNDLPRLADLDAELCEALGVSAGSRGKVRLSELFDRLVRYRNRELGHGAAGQRTTEFYARMGRALLAGTAELLGKLDVLAGRRLVFIDEVRLHKAGHYLVERYALTGESARRLESIEWPASAAARLPMPEQVYLDASATQAADEAPVPIPSTLWSLRPLLAYDQKLDEVLFLNARRERQRTEYLCYTTGEHSEREDLGGEQRALLARILVSPVDGAAFDRWQAEIAASIAPEEAPPVPAAAASKPPRRLSEFELLSELGHGNMGKVYRAWQPSLGRQVALKCIVHGDDAKARSRFHREIRALGRVDHPNLVKIFTSGFDQEPCFYTMELVEGATLAAVCDTLHSRSSTAADVDLETWQQSLSVACEESRKAEKALSEIEGDTGSGTRQAGSGLGGSGLASAHGLADRTYVRQVVDLVRQVALAAHALHEAGVVHRDIKPGNIIVTADGGQAVLMDLGLAQLADDVDGRLTRTRQFVGTLRYASPEQVLAAGGLDRRSDVYSLGATLWELLTLRPLYGATDETPTPELMRRITSGEPERLRKYHPGISADLEAIVNKCLEKDPHRRYPTALELAEDLARWQRGELVRAQPLTTKYVLSKFVRRNRWAIAGAAALLLLAATGLLAELYRIHRDNGRLRTERARALEAQAQAEAAGQRAEAARKRAESAQQDAIAQRDEAKREHEEALRQKARAEEQEKIARRGERDADRNLYTAQLQLAQRAWDDRNVARVLELLESEWPAGGTEDLRGFEWYYLWRQCNGVSQMARAHTKMVAGIAFRGDASILVSTSWDGTLKFWDLTGTAGDRLADRPNFVLRTGATLLGIAFSPDGQGFALGSSSGRVLLIDGLETTTRTLTLAHTLNATYVNSVAFSPDNKLLASGDLDQTVKIWNRADGQLLHTFDLRRGGIGAQLRALNGKFIVTTLIAGGPAAVDGHLKVGDAVVGIADSNGTDDDLRSWNLNQVIDRIRGPLDTELRLRIAPADGSEPQTITLKRQIVPGEIIGVKSVAFSPDGKTLLIASNDGTARLWDLETAKELRIFTGHGDFVNAAVFAPDGQTMATASADGTAAIWDVSTGKILRVLQGHIGAVLTAAYSPDGQTLVTGGVDRTLRFWDPKTGKETDAPLGHTGIVNALAFSPDGKRLATGSSDGILRLWDVQQSRQRAALGHHEGWVSGVAFGPDGSWFATGGLDKTVQIWDVARGTRTKTLTGHTDKVRGLAVSPDGKLIASASGDETVRLWDPTTGDAKHVLREHKGEVFAVAFSPDAGTVASAGDDGIIRLWDVGDGHLRQTLSQPQSQAMPYWRSSLIEALDFSPDGKRLASGSFNNLVQVWDLTSGKELLTVPGLQFSVEHLKFAPDGDHLIISTRDGTVLLWNLETNKPDAEFLGHRDMITFLSLLPGSNRLATGSRDGTVRIWDLEHHQELVSLREGSARFGSGSFSPDGNAMALGAVDGTVYLWRTATDREVGRDHFEMQQWDKAIVDYTRALEKGKKDDPEVHFRRGLAACELERFADAKPDLARAYDSVPSNLNYGANLAAVYLVLGDAEDYRKTCARLLSMTRPTQVSFDAGRVSWACVLLADAVEDHESVVKLAERWVSAHSKMYGPHTALGGALLRAGKYEKAIEALQQSISEHGSGGTPVEWYMLALAHLRLGHAKEADDWFNKSNTWIEEARAQKVQDPYISYPFAWNHELEFKVFRKEYEDLRKNSQPPVAKSGS